MRRNAESLLVLAGAEPARRRGRPVPLADVVRAALGEVEDYARIDLLTLDDVLVKSSGALDIAHLLSELMENADPLLAAGHPGRDRRSPHPVRGLRRVGHRPRHRHDAGPDGRRQRAAGPPAARRPGPVPLARLHRDRPPGRPHRRERAPHPVADRWRDRHRLAARHHRRGHAAAGRRAGERVRGAGSRTTRSSRPTASPTRCPPGSRSRRSWPASWSRARSTPRPRPCGATRPSGTTRRTRPDRGRSGTRRPTTPRRCVGLTTSRSAGREASRRAGCRHQRARAGRDPSSSPTPSTRDRRTCPSRCSRRVPPMRSCRR